MHDDEHMMFSHDGRCGPGKGGGGVSPVGTHDEGAQ
jgi:hypothetical protein